MMLLALALPLTRALARTPTNIFYTHEMAADKACLYARFIETTR